MSNEDYLPAMHAAQLANALSALGFAFFEEGDYNLNLIGVRSSTHRTGAFDDVLFCAYKVNRLWRTHAWPITTDPGAHYLTKPINPEGCAVLASPQQCRGAYAIGEHHGYPALVQSGAPVRVWRDNDKDNEIDWGEDKGIEGWYGINIHRAKRSGITDSPDYHSAGCQVFASRREHDAFMDLCRKSAKIWGNKFTYTIVNQWGWEY